MDRRTYWQSPGGQVYEYCFEEEEVNAMPSTSFDQQDGFVQQNHGSVRLLHGTSFVQPDHFVRPNHRTPPDKGTSYVQPNDGSSFAGYVKERSSALMLPMME